MSVTVGIDLGTTNSLVAWVNPQGQVDIIPGFLGQPLTPSVVCFRDGQPVVGREAKDEQAWEPQPSPPSLSAKWGARLRLSCQRPHLLCNRAVGPRPGTLKG